jgi:hypothetical protein
MTDIEQVVFYIDHQKHDFIFCRIISIVLLTSSVSQIDVTRLFVADNFYFLLSDCTTPIVPCSK